MPWCACTADCIVREPDYSFGGNSFVTGRAAKGTGSVDAEAIEEFIDTARNDDP